MSKKHKSTILKVQAIEYGTVIDHIPSHMTLTVVKILSELEDLVTIGVNLQSNVMGRKGVVKIANRKLSRDEVAKIALIAPHATMSIIESYEVVAKHKLTAPESVEGLVRCTNPNCITNHEPVMTAFSLVKESRAGMRLKCRYCERSYTLEEIEIV